jgi:hypothetical protein
MQNEEVPSRVAAKMAQFCLLPSPFCIRFVCLDPERYRTRVPFRIPEREVDRAAQPFHFHADLESAGCELVEETSQGFGLKSGFA